MDYFHSYLPSQYLNVVYVDNFIFSRLEMFHNLLQCYMIFKLTIWRVSILLST